MYQCELYGCMYNEYGICNYDNANLQFPYAMACNDGDDYFEMEA